MLKLTEMWHIVSTPYVTMEFWKKGSVALKMDASIAQFRIFLEKNWELVSALSKKSRYPDFMENWCQANWELLVEPLLPPGYFLNLYGDGADFGGAESRVSFSDQLPTHRVVLTSKTGRHFDLLTDSAVPQQELCFEQFVSFENGWYGFAPPFDWVLASVGDNQFVVGTTEINFKLERLQ